MGKKNTAGVTGSFGLGIRNGRGDTMVDFCSRNSLIVMNTMFKQHARRLYTWKSRIKLLETRLIIYYEHYTYVQYVQYLYTIVYIYIYIYIYIYTL